MDALATLALVTSGKTPYASEDYGEPSERPWKRARRDMQTAAPESSFRLRPATSHAALPNPEQMPAAAQAANTQLVEGTSVAATSSSMHDAELLLDFSRAMGHSPPASRPSTMYGNQVPNGRPRVVGHSKSVSESFPHHWQGLVHEHDDPAQKHRFSNGTVDGVEVATEGCSRYEWDLQSTFEPPHFDTALAQSPTVGTDDGLLNGAWVGTSSDPTVASRRILQAISPPFQGHTFSNGTVEKLTEGLKESLVLRSEERMDPRGRDRGHGRWERQGLGRSPAESFTWRGPRGLSEFNDQPLLQFSQCDGDSGVVKTSGGDADQMDINFSAYNHPVSDSVNDFETRALLASRHYTPKRGPLTTIHNEWPRHFSIAIHTRNKGHGRKRMLRRVKSESELLPARFDNHDASKGVDMSVWEHKIELPKSTKQSAAGMLEPSQPPTGAVSGPDPDSLSSVCARCRRLWGEPSPFTEDEVNKWIGCDWCGRWFHCACVDLTPQEADDIGKYSCAECQQKQGHTTCTHKLLMMAGICALGTDMSTGKRKSGRAHTSIDYARLNEGVVKTSKESPNHPYIDPIKNRTIKFQPDRFARLAPEIVTLDFFEKGDGMQEPMVIPASMNPQRFDTGDEDVAMTESEADGAIHASSRSSWFLNERLLPEYVHESVFDDGQDKLDMVIPQHLTVRRVAELYGPQEKVEVIDVKSQGEAGSWNLRKWADYYEGKKRTVVRNVISLEISHSKLGRLVRRPKVVRQLDLVDSVWPPELKKKGDFPKVQLYCLMSVADSYTDFHIDFGGSSVFYHILKGKKTFLFIPPKSKNLKKYEQWCLSSTQNQTFLPNETKECIRVDLAAGDTMLIPSGWIHAVWTPEDSLVIGGNFLTRLHFGMQLQIAEIEKTTKVPRKFRHPHFQRVLWFTAIKYLATDPLPPAVEKILCEGGRVTRNGQPCDENNADDASAQSMVDNCQSRTYSEYELNGLPDLGRYLLRTVLISLGKITDGITADTRLKVTRAIPKGHGEPLETIKRFAWWTAWKRGNERIPEWAYPNAEAGVGIPKSMDKKPSAAALKKMEREAAAAARREAPRRKSERGKAKAEAAAKETSLAEDGANLKTEDGLNDQPSHPQGTVRDMQAPAEVNGGLASAVPPGTATDPADGNAMQGLSHIPNRAIYGEQDTAAAMSPATNPREAQNGPTDMRSTDNQTANSVDVPPFISARPEPDVGNGEGVSMNIPTDAKTTVPGNVLGDYIAQLEAAALPQPQAQLPSSIGNDETDQHAAAEPLSAMDQPTSHGHATSPKQVSSAKRRPSQSEPVSPRQVKKSKIQIEVQVPVKRTKARQSDEQANNHSSVEVAIPSAQDSTPDHMRQERQEPHDGSRSEQHQGPQDPHDGNRPEELQAEPTNSTDEQTSSKEQGVAEAQEVAPAANDGGAPDHGLGDEVPSGNAGSEDPNESSRLIKVPLKSQVEEPDEKDDRELPAPADESIEPSKEQKQPSPHPEPNEDLSKVTASTEPPANQRIHGETESNETGPEQRVLEEETVNNKTIPEQQVIEEATENTKTVSEQQALKEVVESTNETHPEQQVVEEATENIKTSSEQQAPEGTVESSKDTPKQDGHEDTDAQLPSTNVPAATAPAINASPPIQSPPSSPLSDLEMVFPPETSAVEPPPVASGAASAAATEKTSTTRRSSTRVKKQVEFFATQQSSGKQVSTSLQSRPSTEPQSKPLNNKKPTPLSVKVEEEVKGAARRSQRLRGTPSSTSTPPPPTTTSSSRADAGTQPSAGTEKADGGGGGRKGAKRKADTVSPTTTGGSTSKKRAGSKASAIGGAGTGTTASSEGLVKDNPSSETPVGKDNEEELKRLAREFAFGLRSRKG